MTAESFVSAVAALDFEHAFNPYRDRCEVHDRSDAPIVRASSLSAILNRAAACPVDAIWVGRDLGYRGGRRTGLALTDDLHVPDHARRWGLSAQRPTCGPIVAERTASVIWSVLDQIDANIFLWNVFPLHPHEAGDPFSNRQHNSKERQAGEEMLSLLVKLLRPRRIIAIGNDAAVSAARVNGTIPVHSVRHPSYGGQRDFVRQTFEIYNVQARGPLL